MLLFYLFVVVLELELHIYFEFIFIKLKSISGNIPLAFDNLYIPFVKKVPEHVQPFTLDLLSFTENNFYGGLKYQIG